MNKCINLNQERAKRLFLNMLEKDGSKTKWEFSQSLKAELIKDPLKVFMAIDTLRDCQEKVPNWFWHNWKNKRIIVKEMLLEVITYSGLVEEIKEEVEGLLISDIVVCEPLEYCKYESVNNCWICKHTKNYKDCKGNSLPELFSLGEPYIWDPEGMEENCTLGIRIGINVEDDPIIQCVYCETMWNYGRDDFCMWNIKGNYWSAENQEKLKRIKKGLDNKEAKWYICPLKCHYSAKEKLDDNK